MNRYFDHSQRNHSSPSWSGAEGTEEQARLEILRIVHRYDGVEGKRKAASICSISSDGHVDNWSLKMELMRKNESPEFQEIFETRERLPAIQQCHDILRSIKGHQVVLIVGSKGCGKTTQIPQMILDDFIFNNCGTSCRIACVQTGKAAAISAAERVAYERLESVGNSIGVQAGERNIKPRETGFIVYCTAQILIRKFKTDPLLKCLTVVILDDIQDQCGEFNQLMGLLQIVLPHRRDLKVILFSTTVAEDTFCEYFRDYHALYVHETFYPMNSKASSVSTLQEIIENVEVATTISDGDSTVVEGVRDRFEKESAYRKSKAFLKKYEGSDISLLSRKVRRQLKRHRKIVKKFETMHPRVGQEAVASDTDPSSSGDTATAKRARTHNDHIVSTTPVKRRRLSSISCHQDVLHVAIIDKSDPHGRMGDVMWLKLEEKLLTEMISNRWCNEGISFEGANWSRGVKIIKCGNNKTLSFLKETISNICEFWPRTHLEIIPRSALPLQIFARVWIPPPVPPIGIILTLIEKQNDGINTENWRIINSQPSKNNFGRDFRIFIDGNSSKVIRECQGRIKFGLNFIRIRMDNAN